MTKLNWEPAAVGCYWNAGEFTISTRVTYSQGKAVLTYPSSGYALTQNREERGIYKTLKAAQRAAEKLCREPGMGVCAECREELTSMRGVVRGSGGALFHGRHWNNA
jgi:hypothetical protein